MRPARFLALAALAGCTSSPRLQDLAGASLEVHLSHSPGGRFAVLITPGALPEGAACRLPAPDARATFNGLPLLRLSGRYALGDAAYDRDCLVEFGFPGATVGTMTLGGPAPESARSTRAASLHVGDGTAMWSLDIPDAFAPRKLEMVSPANGALRRGGKTTVRWTPGTDVLPRQLGLVLRRPGGAPDEEATIGKLAIKGDQITFTVPAGAPESLNGIVHLHVLGATYVTPGIGECPAATCKVSLDFEAEPLTVSLSP